MNLETKRNALMNAIASGQITNLLANTTWSAGYFNGSGGIDGASNTNKERYESEYIDLDNTEKYILTFITANNSNNWCGVATYNSDETFKSRLAYGPGNTFGIEIKNESKIRVSYRTFGNSYIILCTQTEWENFMASNGIYVGD